MKKLFLALFIFGSSSAVFAQSDVEEENEVVKFKEMKHDFGKIKQGVPVTFDFVFTNVGENGVCSKWKCILWLYNSYMAAAAHNEGKSDKIKARFNAASPGVFEKRTFRKSKGL